MHIVISPPQTVSNYYKILIQTHIQLGIVCRHIAWGDVSFTQSGATVIIKWSKTIQDRKETRTINIPYLGHSEICPIAALKTMLCHILGSENDPLFMITKKGIPMVLTDSVARKHLKKVSQLLHIQPPLTFHAFRRAASSWAFQHGVPLEHIQAHGTWKSNAVWSYLRALPSSPLPSHKPLDNTYTLKFGLWESHYFHFTAYFL